MTTTKSDLVNAVAEANGFHSVASRPSVKFEKYFGPMIRGLGGKADDMSGVWRAKNEKSTDRL